MKASSRVSSSPASTRSVVLGTAGHIDHGKTALVFALTGTETDRLPEEKSRGITIDLGFAALRLVDEQDRPFDLHLIDVPGHHAFVRNMLAGAGGIDCVMLVIAADEGVKAQTVEHLAICGLLGIQRGLVVLTKRDAVGAERLAVACEQARRLVERTFLAEAAILAVSAISREGIPELKVELARMAASVPERSSDFIPRLPLDRAFSMRGFGTVVTGTLQAGVVRTGDTLELQPQARTVRVRGAQVHGQLRDQAHAPCRLALNLAGMEVAEVGRGDTLVPPGTLAPVRAVDVELEPVAGAPALRHRGRIRVHAFTSEALATLLLYAVPNDAPRGGPILGRLLLARPILLAPGDRFVLRQPSPAATIGGGRVLDAHPLPRLRKAVTLRWLEQIRAAAPDQQLHLRVVRRGIAGLGVRELGRETGLTVEALRTLAVPMLTDGRLIGVPARAPDHLLGCEALAEAAELLLKEASRAKQGMIASAELHSKTRLSGWVFDLALAQLVAGKRIEAVCDGLALPGLAAGLPALQDKQLGEVEELYRAAGLASPIVSEVAARLHLGATEVRALITALLRAKRLVRMGADTLLVHADALERIIAELRRHRGEQFDVARFKSFTGLSRKHAIPLLEHLDGAHVTGNVGGTRTVL